MTFLKILAVVLFCIALFLALTVFGVIFTVKNTAMDPDFVTAELDQLEISSLVIEAIQIENPPNLPTMNETINHAISKHEPQIKRQSKVAIRSVYDYLLGKKPDPELALTARKTILSTELVTSLVNSVDIAPLAGQFINQQFAQAIPLEIPNLDKYISEALTTAEPALKAQVITISGPIFDFLLGISPTISLTEIDKPVKEALLQTFLNSPPPELAAIPRALREDLFNQAYPDFTSQINEWLRDAKLRAVIAQRIATAEDNLKQARQYVAYFQQLYALMLIFIALTVLGIILIVRDVKGVTRSLSILLFISGGFLYGAALVAKNVASSGKIDLPEVPPEVEPWLIQVINDTLKPLELFSLVVLVLALVLAVTSFVYKRNRNSAAV